MTYICLWGSNFLLFFDLKSRVPPFFLNIPPLISPHPKCFFSDHPFLKIFKTWVLSTFKNWYPTVFSSRCTGLFSPFFFVVHLFYFMSNKILKFLTLTFSNYLHYSLSLLSSLCLSVEVYASWFIRHSFSVRLFVLLFFL